MESNQKLMSSDIRLGQDPNQNIQVFVRVRPMNSLEVSKKSLVTLDCPGTREVVVKERSPNNTTKTFTFDRVFGPTSKQLEVYKTVVAPLIEQVLLGYNCTVFAYGQTGTGKTFTMEGERSTGPKAESLTWESDPLTGIVPRALSQLFDDLRLQNAEFTVRVSLLELYNEELIDLLSPSDDVLKTLRLFEDSSRKGSVVIQGLEEVTVHSKHEVYAIMERGSIRRKTAATQMNAHSSRSHCVFTITVHIKETSIDGEELLKIGKLNLVDLAGSENIGRSGAVEKRAREAGSINQSLLTLGRVITALVERTPHVPYRESKLTRILQESLGGRTKTSIIATVSPASYNVEETLSTLDYAHRAKNIQNRPEINQKMTKRALLKAYTEEIERLRRDLHATREKNGVFMDKENYDTITAQIECQNQDLSSKIAEVRALQEVVAKKEEELVSVKEQWEETKDDLAAANQVLKETRHRLDQTILKLRDTELQRDQQEHLVEKHVVTEKHLTSEAAHLMATTEESTSSLEKLYRKLDRKKTVEQTNLEAGRRFKEDLGTQFNSMCISLETFRVDHSTFCGSQRMKMDTFLQDKEIQFAGLSDQMTNFLNEIRQLTILDKSITEDQTTSTESFSSSLAGEIQLHTDEAMRQIVGYQENVCTGVIVKLQRELKSLLEGMNKIGGHFKSQINAQGNLINDYITARVRKLESNRKVVETFLKDQIEAGTRAADLAKQSENMAHDYVKTFDDGLGTLMGDLAKVCQGMTAFRSMLESNSKLQLEGASKSMSQLKEFKKSFVCDYDVNKTEASLLRNSSSVMSSSAETAMNTEFANYNANFEESVNCVSNLENTIQEHTVSQKDTWVKAREFVEDRIKRQTQSLRAFDEKHSQHTKTFESQSEGEVGEMFEKISTDITASRELVSSGRSALEIHCNVVSKWAEETRASVLQNSGKLGEFWEATYVVDLPSGMTPQRRVYDFPRNLSATSPHDRIINRFTAIRGPQPPALDETF